MPLDIRSKNLQVDEALGASQNLVVPVSGPAEARLRCGAAGWEQSVNGGAWTPLGGGPSAPALYGPVVVNSNWLRDGGTGIGGVRQHQVFKLISPFLGTESLTIVHNMNAYTFTPVASGNVAVDVVALLVWFASPPQNNDFDADIGMLQKIDNSYQVVSLAGVHTNIQDCKVMGNAAMAAILRMLDPAMGPDVYAGVSIDMIPVPTALPPGSNFGWGKDSLDVLVREMHPDRKNQQLKSWTEVDTWST